MLLLLLACGGPSCSEGELYRGGECVPYEPGEPVQADVWSPAPGTSWQWQLTGRIDATVDVQMVDIDLFDAPDDVLAELSDRTVICYFSAGSIEDWRPDAGDFPADAIGKKLDGWEGERWLDIRSEGVRDVMRARLDLAVQRGCDGVEPDNVDGWDNGTGFPLTRTEQLAFDRFLADEAHSRGLSVGLKNALESLEDLVDWFDWALNEECVSYDECGRLKVFTEAGKAAFHVEYVDDWADASDLAAEVCGVGPQLDTLIKTWDVGAEFLPCP